MAFELSPITDDPGQDQEDGQTGGSSPLDPDEIAEMMTPDGTAHPDDFGQVALDDPQSDDDTKRQSGSGPETGRASGSTSR